ncbi:MAG: long-chain fatty acid--CoA ligase [Actinomycetota bacterium]|nr:long-chain fatty acid--CoA ligase [Actinomycetota bacterium]
MRDHHPRPDLAARLSETAERRPDHVALRWQDRATTYGELDRLVTHAAGGLQRLGVGQTDRVAVMLGNTPAFVEAFLGALRAGATVVPLNPALTGEEVGSILADSGAHTLIVGEAGTRGIDKIRSVAGGSVHHVVVTGNVGAPRGTATWRELVNARHPYTPVERSPDDVAALVYTSGTTGRPKGAMLTRRNLAANQDQVLATPLAVQPDDVVLAVLPLFHIYALNVGLGSAVRIGATIVLTERFDPSATLDLIDRHRVTVVLGAPPMYLAWLNTPRVAEAGWSSVRVAVSGAAPLPAPVLERFRDEVGVTIWEGYGLTEAGPAVTTTAMGGVAKPGSVGAPLPGVELRLVDDAGRAVEPGDPGEVWVRGPNVFVGYWDDPAETAATLTPDGWLRTGDVGIFDADGDLRLVDRLKDLIIVSGFNVYPREVEDVLHRHPDILAAAAVGVAHPYAGEAVKAFVVRRPGAELTEDDVVAWAQEHLARFKCPAVVEFVGQLPHTATGKVRRTVLRSEPASRHVNA